MNDQRRIRVVFVLTTPDAIGGTERATFHVASELARRPELEVSVLGVFRRTETPHFAADLRVPIRYVIDDRERPATAVDTAVDTASKLVDAHWEPAFSARSDRLMAEALLVDPPDVLVATTPALLALISQTASPRSAIIGIEHRATAARGVSGEPLRLYAHCADAFVSLTRDGTEWFAASLGAAAPLLATIPNLLPHRAVPRSSLVQPLVVTGGRLVRSKQFDHIVRAFARSRRPGWRLRIFGDGPERHRIERAILSLGVHDHVDLVASAPDLQHEFAKASMLVMSSTAEGQPMVALEALATGIPIISYDCPVGPRSIIDDGVNGFLVAPNDDVALGDRMRDLIDDVDLRQRLGQAAWASRSRFAPDAVADQWHDLVTMVASNGPRRSDSVGRPAALAPRSSTGGDSPWVPRGGLLLHIGPHKTGTTAIQSAFSADREALAALGVVYPGSTPAPHGAVMNRLGTYRGWDDAIAPGSLEGWEQLCVQARTASGSVVVSSEALCHASDEQARLICRELRPGPARVVITVRALEHVLPSSWQEYVKSGWTITFDEFLHAVLEAPDSPDNPVPTFWARQDLGRLVRRWTEAVGRDHVVVVVADPSNRSQLFRTFEDLLGLPQGILRADAGAANRSLTLPEVEMLRRVNLLSKQSVPWKRFNQLLRQGGTPQLVEGRRPPADEARLALPAWAVERARSLGARAVDQIRATGVRVDGDLGALTPAAPRPPTAVPASDCTHVPIDAVVGVIEGLVVKINEVELSERSDG
jgi:glycosyltransferase involved in cell wall biosynthesis